MARATEEVRSHEQNTEAQWHSALEQWQTDKQSLQQQKGSLEQELVNMQNRFQAELRQTDEVTAKLKMDIAFKETHASGQQERMQSQMQRDLDPLRDRLARLMSEEESERVAWETRLRAKDDELKALKARLALREKRLQEESSPAHDQRKSTNCASRWRKKWKARAGITRRKRTQLEKLLMERREALARLQAGENEWRQTRGGSRLPDGSSQLQKERASSWKKACARFYRSASNCANAMKRLFKERDTETRR